MTLEKLLNILCERGWKPRNKDLVKLYIKYGDIQLRRGTENRPNEEVSRAIMSKRELVSKESGLWQFCVCEGLVKKNTEMVDDGVPTDDYAIGRYIQTWSSVGEDGIPIDDDWEIYSYYQDRDYLWWVIESALHDEGELEQFLLDNIKV